MMAMTPQGQEAAMNRSWNPKEKGYEVVGGEVNCPLPKQDWRLHPDDEEGDERIELVPCNESLHLVWTTSIPIDEGRDSYQTEDASYRHWKVECAGGHVLLDGYDDGDGTKPFDPLYDMPEAPKWQL